MNTTTHNRDIEAALASSTDEGLIEGLIQITHQIHSANEYRDGNRANLLRESRDVLRAEILRRMNR